jgi:hypothetical protein
MVHAGTVTDASFPADGIADALLKHRDGNAGPTSPGGRHTPEGQHGR